MNQKTEIKFFTIFSKNLLHDEINMEKQRDSTISINKKLTKTISNSKMFGKTMYLSEYNTLDEIIQFFIFYIKLYPISMVL